MKVFGFLFLLFSWVNLALAQDTLKTKYQTKEVLIKEKPEHFTKQNLFVSESGVFLEEEARIGKRFRRKIFFYPKPVSSSY